MKFEEKAKQKILSKNTFRAYSGEVDITEPAVKGSENWKNGASEQIQKSVRHFFWTFQPTRLFPEDL